LAVARLELTAWLSSSQLGVVGMIKIYLDISQTYHKDIPDEKTADRLAHLIKYILEDKIPLDTVEKAVQSLNWSEETQKIITDAADLVWNKMQEEIKNV
jgi:hypothetical protein